MKTWLVYDKESGWVNRYNEYDDPPEMIGIIEDSNSAAARFVSYGDNRTLSSAELQQLLDFCTKP